MRTTMPWTRLNSDPRNPRCDFVVFGALVVHELKFAKAVPWTDDFVATLRPRRRRPRPGTPDRSLQLHIGTS